jgi:uncharacterized protein
MESNAYDLGRILTEQFSLPNLKDKGKKRSLTRYVYDLTDRHRGFGQLLDKKATLRQIVETNIAPGQYPGHEPHRPVGPHDRPPRQGLPRAVPGEGLRVAGHGLLPARLLRLDEGRPPSWWSAQHVLIYSWLLYQYAGRSRPASSCTTPRPRRSRTSTPTTTAAWPAAPRSPRPSSWSTRSSAREPGQDYNIYVFHGTDGDDWDTEGKECLPELEAVLPTPAGLGMTIVGQRLRRPRESEVEVPAGSGPAGEAARPLRLDVMPPTPTRAAVIEGIRQLISRNRGPEGAPCS